jgi:chromosome segregation ATPase
VKESRLCEVLQLLKEKESVVASLHSKGHMEGRGCVGRVEDRVTEEASALHTRIEELEVKCRNHEEISSEMCSRNSLLEKKVFALCQDLADKDCSLGEIAEELQAHKDHLCRLESENRDMKEQLTWLNKVKSENQSLRENQSIVMDALSNKEQVIVDLLSKIEELKEALSLAANSEQMRASEELRNENQRLELHISLQENQLRMKENRLSELEDQLREERKKWQLLVPTPEEKRQLMGSLDIRQAVLRSTLSEKDVQIADLEKRWMKKGKKRYGEELAQLKVERESIKKELKGLNHHSTTMRRFGRQESRTDLYRECQGASREQILQEIYRLNSAGDKLKQFIDMFLVVILEKSPVLLQDMPRSLGQYNTGVRPHVLATASKSDLLAEVKEQEYGCNDLLMYNSELFERVVTQDTSILDHLLERMTR